MNWLFKEEPESYDYERLTQDGGTSWTGVRNPLAQKNLRSVRKGDSIFFYYTGGVKAVVGVMKASRDAYPDPADRSGKLYAVDVAPARKLKRPVTLAEIKSDGRFDDFALTRQPRLSVMPVTDAQWRAIEALSDQPE